MAGLSCWRVCGASSGRLRLFRWCMAPPMVGRVAVMCGPPHGGAWCGGVWHPSWWGVVWCFVAPRMVGHAVVVFGPLFVGRAIVVCGPLHGAAWRGGAWPIPAGAWCGGVWHPSWWRILRRCVAPLMVGLWCVVLCRAALRYVVL